MKLGKDILFKYIEDFGFGKKTGIDLNGETSGILFKLDKVNDLELATTAFGQGISVTPIQQVKAVSAVVNGGNLYTPYLVKSFNEPETNSIIKKVNPTLERKVISTDTSSLTRYVLESVVANGTGRNAYIENYRVGGKTGTAQKVSDGRYLVGNYILSFIGFMPADNPEIVIYVAVDNAKGVVQYGGTVAAPVARNIFKDAISILDIKEDQEGFPKEYLWYDVKYKKVPNVIGRSIDEAKTILKGFKIEYSGSGDTIIYQSPTSDLMVKENSKIKLMLGN